MTPTSSGAAEPTVDPARSTRGVSLKTFSSVSRVATKCVLCTMIHGMRERHVKSMTIERAALAWGVKRDRRGHLPGPFRGSRRNVQGGVDSVGGILRRMAVVII